MRKTKYIPGYGYVTGKGFWKDAGTDIAIAAGRKIATAIGDKLGRSIAKKVIPDEKKLPEEVRRALYQI